MNYHFNVESINLNNKQLYPSTDIFLPLKGITLITGANGCGKTTLMKHILYKNPESITLIAQENDLIFSDMTVADNIMLFKNDKKKLSKLLSLFEIKYILEREPGHLSGGEKRLVSLLRMFFVENEIIFLDEPTNDLDYRAVETVKAIISELASQKSLMIVTHDDRLIPLANQIYNFNNGKIIADEKNNPDEEIIDVQKNVSKLKIKKLIHTDIIGNLLFLLIILSIVLVGVIGLFSDTPKMEVLKDNQTNFVSKFYSNPKTMLENGYIPLEAYKKYSGSVNVDYLKSYSKSLQEALNSGGTLNMSLEKSIGKAVIPCIYLDVISNEKKYIMKQYQAEKYQKTNLHINFSEKITVFDGISEIAEKYEDGISEDIDYEVYENIVQKTIEEINDNQPIMYVVLDLDKKKLSDIDGNIFVKNNDTIKICQKLNSLQSFINCTKVLIISVIGSLFLYYLYLFINVKLFKKYIIIMRNLAIPCHDVKQQMKKIRVKPLLKFVISLLGAIVCLSISLTHSEHIALFSLLALISAITGISVIITTHNIMNHCINNIYNFEGIYEN